MIRSNCNRNRLHEFCNCPKSGQKTKRDFSNDLPVASFVVLMNPLSIEIHGGCIPCIIATCYCEFVMPHINILNEK